MVLTRVPTVWIVCSLLNFALAAQTSQQGASLSGCAVPDPTPPPTEPPTFKPPSFRPIQPTGRFTLPCARLTVAVAVGLSLLLSCVLSCTSCLHHVYIVCTSCLHCLYNVYKPTHHRSFFFCTLCQSKPRTLDFEHCLSRVCALGKGERELQGCGKNIV